MDPQTVDLEPLDMRAGVASVDDDARTVELIFSTGAGVVRYDWTTGRRYLEKLSLNPKHVRLGRLNAGAPLLDSHSAYRVADQIGVVVDDSARVVDSKEGRVSVRFSKRADVDPIWGDVRDGILRNVSVGYRVHKFEETTGVAGGEMPVRTAVDWEPFEVSMVPMGADAGARVREQDKSHTNPCQIIRSEQELPAMDEQKIPTPAPAPVDADAIRAEAIQAERARADGIQAAVRVAKLDASVAADLVKRGVTLDAARAEIFALLAAKDAETPTEQRLAIVPGEDARDKFLRGAAAWLVVKGGAADMVTRAAEKAKADAPNLDPGEFRGMTLLDVARECLERAGVKTRGLDKMALVGQAFMHRAITQSTSDFTTLLENVMHKMLQASYATAPDTWSRWCNRSTVSDFRAHNRYRMGAFGALDSLLENGEFKNKAINDAEKATITAATKGNIINVSRQMIVNDDMNAFARLLTMLGRAAGLTVEIDAYALLLQNSGLGPTQSDAQPLFHANRVNVSTGAALSVNALDADRVVMAQQKDPWGNEFLDLRPAVLLVPIGLGGQARVTNDAQYDVDATSKFQVPNKVRGLFREVVDTPRLTGTRRYLFADPSVAPVFEVAFLEGQTAPVLESQEGWRVDGAEMKVRFDFGVAAVDFRGAVTNAGV